jgi:hypothetical protein
MRLDLQSWVNLLFVTHVGWLSYKFVNVDQLCFLIYSVHNAFSSGLFGLLLRGMSSSQLHTTIYSISLLLTD